MIRRLRIKFVLVSMALVTAVLATVLGVVYVSLRENITDLSDQILYRAVREDRLPGFNESSVMLPYFTVNVIGSTAYVTGGTYDDLENTQVLSDILSLCLSREASSGILEEYQLRYLRQEALFSKRIAFVDMSMEAAMLREMMDAFLLVAGLGFLLLLAISIALAVWITRPVERAWKQQRQFLSDASHELKTPLTVILSNAELLNDAALTGSPGRWVDNIRSEAGQMRTLVEQMLTLARADSGSAAHAAVLTETDLSELVTEVCLAFEPVAFEVGKPLDYEVAGDLQVLADGDKLRRLVSILLDNAIKYGSGTIRLRLEGTDRQARLTVANPGTPIPPEQLGRLFERFYRADASRGENSGFGLGLPIAAAIAAEHKGSIRVESDEVSTRFLFTMALKK